MKIENSALSFKSQIAIIILVIMLVSTCYAKHFHML